MRTQHSQDGITLLVTLLLMGVLLGVSSSLLNVTLKQFQLSGIAVASEVAFQSADAGMECVKYHDYENHVFDQVQTASTARVSISCFNEASEPDMNSGNVVSGSEQRFQFSWGDPEICSDVTIYKFYHPTSPVSVILPDGTNMNTDRNNDGDRTDPGDDCPAGSTCTVVQSRGYNLPCSSIGGGGRVVEREYTQVY